MSDAERCLAGARITGVHHAGETARRRACHLAMDDMGAEWRPTNGPSAIGSLHFPDGSTLTFGPGGTWGTTP